MADLLEKHGDAEVYMASANIWFEDKAPFMELARDFVRPYSKDFQESEYGDLILSHGKLNKDGSISLRIQRSNICIMKEPARPAVYDCPSIFSPEEEEELEKA